MRNLAAYLLAKLGGNENPQVKDVKNILGSVGIEGDDAAIQKVIDSLKGKDIEALIAEGAKKIVSVPSGGAAPAAAAPAAAAAAAPAAHKESKKEEKKEEKKEAPKKEEKKAEPEPEEDADMGFGLFD